MEIEYSNFEIDTNIFGKNEICGIYDKNSQFIYNNFYDIKKIEYNTNISVNAYLKTDLKNRKLIKNLINDLEITQDILKKKLSTLSSSILIKVLIIKVCTSSAKLVILEHIDTYLNNRDLNTLFLALKRYIEDMDKSIIFSTGNINNVIEFSNRYIIASDNKIIYNRNTIDSLPEKTDIMDFVNLANKHGAKLNYYKDTNDLLKAIYRSVQK